MAVAQIQTGAEHRHTRRKPVLMAGLVALAGEASLDCTIRDTSGGGARISLPRSIELPQILWLINIKERSAHEALVVWRGELETGLSFGRSLSLSAISDPALTFLKRLWLQRATR